MSWENTSKLISLQYKCGHCDRLVASDRAYRSGITKTIYICPHCDNPTYCKDIGELRSMIPSPCFGNPVRYLPDEVQKLYDEARKCTSDSSYTAAVMVCRKLIMHIAVEKGEEENKSFKEYVTYLDKGGYLPAGSKDWVDYIRDQGNEANHEIALKNESDAKNLVEFIEMMIKLIYEFPARMSNRRPNND